MKLKTQLLTTNIQIILNLIAKKNKDIYYLKQNPTVGLSMPKNGRVVNNIDSDSYTVVKYYEIITFDVGIINFIKHKWGVLL